MAGVCAAGGGVAAGGVNDGRTGVCGTINLGAGGASTGFGGAATGACATGGAGFTSTGGAGGRGGATGAAGACLLIMALSTSPGLEMFDRSILVLISSGSERPEREA